MFQRGSAAALALAALGTLSTGCASQKDALTRDLSEMKRELQQLRATSSALKERIEALEQSGAAPAGAKSAAASENPPAEGSDRPKLEVVRLLPEEPPSDGWTSDPAPSPPAAAPAADEGPRPVIRGDRNGAKVDEPGAPTSKHTPKKGIPSKR